MIDGKSEKMNRIVVTAFLSCLSSLDLYEYVAVDDAAAVYTWWGSKYD